MSSRYRLHLMFDWGGGCLWCGNDAARKRFGGGPVERRLGLSPQTVARLEKLSRLHDGALDWSYPPDPGDWTAEQFEAFDVAAGAILERLRVELGPAFSVSYHQLGRAD